MSLGRKTRNTFFVSVLFTLSRMLSGAVVWLGQHLELGFVAPRVAFTRKNYNRCSKTPQCLFPGRQSTSASLLGSWPTSMMWLKWRTMTLQYMGKTQSLESWISMALKSLTITGELLLRSSEVPSPFPQHSSFFFLLFFAALSNFALITAMKSYSSSLFSWF